MAEDPECTTREICAVSVFIDINKEGATGIYWYQ